jgi:hypothetical protein
MLLGSYTAVVSPDVALPPPAEIVQAFGALGELNEAPAREVFDRVRGPYRGTGAGYLCVCAETDRQIKHPLRNQTFPDGDV